jgi:hypothetical protein
MKTRSLSAALRVVCLVLLTAGCNLQAGGAGPQTWIDAPLDGMTLPLAPVLVRSHAASDDGTAQAALLVNGAQVRVDQAADSSGQLIEFAQPWIPSGPGDYVLQVITLNHAGAEGLSNLVHVRIGDLVTDTPTSLLPEIPPPPSVTPSSTGVTQPSFRFDVPGNCREGPSTLYAVLTSFLAGEEAPIEGRNADNSWFWLLMPGGGHCWAAASTGTPLGPYAETDVIQPPPPPAITTEAPPPVEATTEAPPPQQPPPAPGGFSLNELVCSSEAYTVRLSWNDVAGEQGYRVYRDGALIMSLGANATQYDDSPGNYESHAYRVEAWNGSGANSTGVKNSAGCVF